jgi:hypothetical protein
MYSVLTFCGKKKRLPAADQSCFPLFCRATCSAWHFACGKDSAKGNSITINLYLLSSRDSLLLRIRCRSCSRWTAGCLSARASGATFCCGLWTPTSWPMSSWTAIDAREAAPSHLRTRLFLTSLIWQRANFRRFA